jgi:hypothetical protein
MSNNKDGLMLKMKKRTQEFLNAANIAAAKSIKNVSNSSNFTDLQNQNELQESKSYGRVEEDMHRGTFGKSQSESFESEKYKKIIQGNIYYFNTCSMHIPRTTYTQT